MKQITITITDTGFEIDKSDELTLPEELGMLKFATIAAEVTATSHIMKIRSETNDFKTAQI